MTQYQAITTRAITSTYNEGLARRNVGRYRVTATVSSTVQRIDDDGHAIGALTPTGWGVSKVVSVTDNNPTKYSVLGADVALSQALVEIDRLSLALADSAKYAGQLSARARANIEQRLVDAAAALDGDEREKLAPVVSTAKQAKDIVDAVKAVSPTAKRNRSVTAR